jgi:hypothetical protein
LFVCLLACCLLVVCLFVFVTSCLFFVQRLCGGVAEGRVGAKGIDDVSDASSASQGASDEDENGPDKHVLQHKKQRSSSPAFDLVAFFDRLSTR